MFNIGSFLKKISNNLAGSDLEKKIIIEEVYKTTNIQITEKDIEIKNYILFISGSPAIKNKLFMFKEGILNELNKKLEVKLVDIR